VGRWDESLAIHEAEIARIEAGVPHYLETQHRQSRSRIRLGRGDLQGALDDTTRAIAAGREARDPQAVLPCLAEHARALSFADRSDEAVGFVDEMIALNGREPSLDWAWWILPAAMILTDAGRAGDVLALGGEELPCRWVRAARRWAADDLEGAADELRDMGAAPDEGYVRLRLAEELIGSGRRTEADPHLDRARALFWAMDATAFLAQADRLLAPPA
jgi:hypothetical protein